MSDQQQHRKTTRIMKLMQGVKVLSDFSRRIDKMDIPSLAAFLCDTISREFGISNLNLYLQDGRYFNLAKLLGKGDCPEKIKIGAKTRRALAEREGPITFADLSVDERLPELAIAFSRYRPSLIFPMLHRKDIVGLCVLGRPEKRGPLSIEERKLMSTIVRHAGLALAAINTRRKAREATRMLHIVKKEKQAYEEHKDDIVRITCHEFNTPLTVITLSANMLMEEADGELTFAQKKLVREILISSSRLAEANNDLVYLAQRGITRKSHREWCNFEEIFTQVLEKTSILFARRPDLDVRISIDEGIPEIHVIPQDIVRALTNIIQNAIKFTPEENGRVNISAGYENGEVICEIKDNGIGIDREYQELVFEPFIELIDNLKRSSSKTRFLGAGLGLGLTIARDIIERHKGKVTLESEGENKGTTVRAVIPAHGDAS